MAKQSKQRRAMNASLTSPTEDEKKKGRDYPRSKRERVEVGKSGKAKRPGYGRGPNARAGFNPDRGTAAADEAAKFGEGGFQPAQRAKRPRPSARKSKK